MMRWLSVVLCLAASTAMAKEAEVPAAPYEVALEARGGNSPTGHLAAWALVEAGSYPPAFLGHMEAQLRQQPIEPKLADGVPATFDTTIYVGVTITPKSGGADARIDDIIHGPGILRRTTTRFPRDLLQVEGWKGRVIVQCTVSVEGRCGPVEIVREDPGMPESGRRFARESIALWTFEPQRVGGKPVTGDVRIPFVIESKSHSSLPPKKFGK